MNITQNLESKCVMARVMRFKKRYQRNFTFKEYGTYEAAELRSYQRFKNDK
jgi:hypothetical protein